jgi:hypothetical protein
MGSGEEDLAWSTMMGTDVQADLAEEFASKIRDEMKASSRSWFRIVRIFGDADLRNIKGKDKTRPLCEAAGVGYSAVKKLIKCAKDKRLTKYENLLLVESWTVLHVVALLDADEFVAFEEKYLRSNIPVTVTRSQVEQFRKTRTPKAEKLRATIVAEPDLPANVWRKINAACGELENNKCTLKFSDGFNVKIKEAQSWKSRRTTCEQDPDAASNKSVD